jgi:hypothetical protein
MRPTRAPAKRQPFDSRPEPVDRVAWHRFAKPVIFRLPGARGFLTWSRCPAGNAPAELDTFARQERSHQRRRATLSATTASRSCHSRWTASAMCRWPSVSKPTKLVDGTRKQVAIVRAQRRRRRARAYCALLRRADWPLIGGSFTIRGVEALWPKKLYPRLQSAGPLGRETLLEIHRTLATALPPG